MLAAIILSDLSGDQLLSGLHGCSDSLTQVG
jgi:hypothetical protein